MSKNIRELPFTEIVERAMEISRTREDSEGKIRGYVNDIYVRDLPRKNDWTFLIATTSLIFTEEYKTGTVTATTGDATLTFSSDVVIDSAMVGRKIKINGNDYIYEIASMSGTTGAVVGPTFSGTKNLSSATYTIFQPKYPLVTDFARFPKNGRLHLFQGGRRKNIPEIAYQDQIDIQTAVPNDNQEFCRVLGQDTAGNQILEVIPPPKNDLAVEYDYFKQVRPLRETTAGVLDTIAAGGTTVTGSAGTTRFTEATTGDYFRVDAFGTSNDSEWYKIIAIAHDSSLTLATAFGLSAATSASYTICSSPNIPVEMHPSLLYGTIMNITLDQDDPAAAVAKQEYANHLTDGKRIYTSRMFNQQVTTIAEDFQYRR